VPIDEDRRWLRRDWERLPSGELCIAARRLVSIVEGEELQPNRTAPTRMTTMKGMMTRFRDQRGFDRSFDFVGGGDSKSNSHKNSNDLDAPKVTTPPKPVVEDIPDEEEPDEEEEPPAVSPPVPAEEPPTPTTSITRPKPVFEDLTSVYLLLLLL
jgi:hypothetical protein